MTPQEQQRINVGTIKAMFLCYGITIGFCGVIHWAAQVAPSDTAIASLYDHSLSCSQGNR